MFVGYLVQLICYFLVSIELRFEWELIIIRETERNTGIVILWFKRMMEDGQKKGVVMGTIIVMNLVYCLVKFHGTVGQQ